MSNAKSISIGPLVVADAPKKMMRLMSSIPKTTLTIKSGSGRGVFQFMRLFILSFAGGEVLVICSICPTILVVQPPDNHRGCAAKSAAILATILQKLYTFLMAISFFSSIL